MFSSGVDWLAVLPVSYLLGSSVLALVSLGGMKTWRESPSKLTSIFISFPFVAWFIGAPTSGIGNATGFPKVVLQKSLIRILNSYNQCPQVRRISELQGQGARYG